MSRQLLAIYGTEFCELDEEQAKLGPQKKPTPIQDQIATDQFGKRRFHGAFTGGFSAGYWNTVGSKEGWAPTEFRSSRDQRTNLNQIKPEDIMDAEDLGEHGIGARRIRQTETFARDNASKRRMAWEHDTTTSSSITELLAGIIKPSKMSIGSQILHRMGWREGRGVGLATLKQAKTREGRTTEAQFDKEQLTKIAPGYDLSLEDELVVQLTPYTGTHGLGYTGLKSTNVLDEKWGLLEASLKADNLARKSKGIRGQAFGVGVFEDDDESVYTNFDMSQYDFALEGPGGKEPQIQVVDFSFEEMPKKQQPRKFYNAPKLPTGWRPNHKSIAIDISKFPEALKNAMNALTIEQRARLLGEDFINKAKERETERGKGKRSRWDEKNEKPQENSDLNRIEFSSEPMKQRRFKEYLSYVRRGIPWSKPMDLTVWEWESEKKEFESKLTYQERALLPEVRSRLEPLAKSNLSLPIKELLQNKFTAETGSSGLIGRKDEDKLAAVKMNMFGDRTRSLYEWYPENLLTKRFNVPNPHPGITFSGCPHLQKIQKKETLMNLGLPNTAAELILRKNEPEFVQSDEMVEIVDDPHNRETFVIQQPMTIFDAIFANDDNSEDETNIEPSNTEVDEEPEIVEIETNEPSTRQKFVTVMDLYKNEEYGPSLPPDLPQMEEALPGFSVLRYLQEELKDRKRSKHSKDRKEDKHSKKKKEKKLKKSHKHKKHKKRESTNSSDDQSSHNSPSKIRNVITIE